MCGLVGYLSYSDKNIKSLEKLTNSLMSQAAERGTDAAEIAFCTEHKITLLKESRSARELEFKHGDGVKAFIGHTRHLTQGSEKKNYNNHPFLGKTSGGKFALAHNGVLINDYDLRKDLKLPKTQIETDSFVVVQLIEKKRRLNFESLKYMAEKVCGSVSDKESEKGILVCGTGIGMSICANKIKGIRAAHVTDTYSARMSKEHNNANVICLGERITGCDLALEIVKAYLGAEFQGGRHQKRVDKIMALEK